MYPYRWLAALPLAVTLSGPAVAGPLTFAGALERADATAPSLQASVLKVDAARAASRAAGRLPDPKLSAGIQDFPVTGPNAGSFTRDDFTMAKVGVMQEVPNAARRRADVAGATAEVGVAEAMTAEERLKVRVATALAWIDLAYAERRLATLDQLTAGLKDLWSAQPAAIAAGSVRPASGLEPARLRAVFEDRRSELVAAAVKARAELTRWTDEPAVTTVGEPPHFEVDPVALRAALDRHPSLLVAEAGQRRAETEVAAARAATRPDWGFEVAYGRRDPRFGDLLSAGVTVSLPLFKVARQEPVIAARLADRTRAQVDREDRRRELVAALEADLADHVMHHDQWQRALTVLVPTAEQRAHLEVTSYGAARASFDDVRMALTDLADARLGALEREAMTARDGARILLTYGADQ